MKKKIKKFTSEIIQYALINKVVKKGVLVWDDFENKTVKFVEQK